MLMDEFTRISGEPQNKSPNFSVRALVLFNVGAVRAETFHCRYLRTSSVTVAVCVTPPPLAVMVMVWFPSVALLPTLTVIVEVPDPGAAIELGLKVTV